MLYGNMRDGVTEPPVDLHVHSTASDGTYTPSELVEYAIKKGLAAMALTDHDTVDGLKEIRDYAGTRENSPEIINGIELSTDLNGKDIHIVGLFIDETEPAFLHQLEDFRNSREIRNEKMCAGLRDGLHMDISFSQLKETFPNAVITRAHYAKYMVQKGYIKSTQEAFDRWIGDGCPYFVPREKVTPMDGIHLIQKAHGIPVLAHPLLYGLSRARLDSLIEDLKAEGLVAMETIYTTFSQGETNEMKEMAEAHGLLQSGGSDFHGTNKVNTDLGTGRGNLFIPLSFLEKLRDYHKKYC